MQRKSTKSAAARTDNHIRRPIRDLHSVRHPTSVCWGGSMSADGLRGSGSSQQSGDGKDKLGGLDRFGQVDLVAGFKRLQAILNPGVSSERQGWNRLLPVLGLERPQFA